MSALGVMAPSSPASARRSGWGEHWDEGRPARQVDQETGRERSVEGGRAELPALISAQLLDQSVAVASGETMTVVLATNGFDASDLVVDVAAYQPLADVVELAELAEGLRTLGPSGPPGSGKDGQTLTGAGADGPVATFRGEPGRGVSVEAGGVLTVTVPVVADMSTDAGPEADGTAGAGAVEAGRSPTDADDAGAVGPGNSSTAEDDGVGVGEGEGEGGESAPSALVLTDAGVHPLTITVSDGTGAWARVETTVVKLPGQGEPAPVGRPTALLLVVTEHAGGGTDATPDPASAAEVGMGLEETITLLEDGIDAPVTIMVRRSSLARLKVEPELAARFVSAVGGRPVVGEQAHPVDPSALAAIGQWRLYRRARAELAVELQTVGLTPDGATVVVVDPVTDSAAVALLADGVSTVVDLSPRVVDATAVPPVIGNVTTVAGTLLVVSAGPAQAEVTAFDQGQRSVAELVLSEDPPTTPAVIVPRSRGLAVGAGPGSPHPSRPVLDALVTVPWLVPASFAALGPDVEVEQLVTGEAPALDLSALVDPLAEADRWFATYSSFYVDGDRSPHDVLLSLSRATASDLSPAEREAAVLAVSAELEDAMTVISLPVNQSVTMAARTAAIPLAVESSASGARRVVLRFRSDKLDTADRVEIEIEPGSSVVDVEVEARSLGTSPLSVTVLTPDERQVLATTRFRVRSTAVPGLGLLLSAGGLAMLAAWWYVHIRRRRASDGGGDDQEPGAGGTGESRSNGAPGRLTGLGDRAGRLHRDPVDPEAVAARR